MNIKKLLQKTPMIKYYRKIRAFVKQTFYSLLPEKKHLDIKFLKVFGRHIDWENPKSFNEKLQWLKVYNKNPQHTMLVDKYEVREYIKKIIGEEYLIPVIAVYDKVSDIDFDALPDSFVLKCTHGSACNIICSDKSKLDVKAAKKKLKKWMKINYYYLSREWPYKNVKPRIVCEKFMKDDTTNDLKDYKFFCFEGKVHFSFVASDRHTDEVKFNFFDSEWNDLPVENDHPRVENKIKKPVNYEKMIELAEQLSKDELFLRVDFYEINGRIYFGELTYYHGGGFLAFKPEEYDYKFGELIDISKIEKIN